MNLEVTSNGQIIKPLVSSGVRKLSRSVGAQGAEDESSNGSASCDPSTYRTEPCVCQKVAEKPHTHVRHIPVGMPGDAWKRICQVQRVLAAQERHAVWVARQVARHIETFKLTGQWMGMLYNGHITSTKDALSLLEGNNLFSSVLNGYCVAEGVREVCMTNIRQFAQAKFVPKVAKHAK